MVHGRNLVLSLSVILAMACWSAPIKAERLPKISMERVVNALPNSSFECGGAGWGYVKEKSSDGEPFELLGQCDRSQSFSGKSSWKLTLSADHPLMNYAASFFAVVSRIPSLQIGNEGWISVAPGKPYVLSAYVRSDRPELSAHCTIVEVDGRQESRSFKVGEGWQRIEVAHRPKGEQVYCVIGFTPSASDHPDGTLWIDAVQFERGEAATPYQPRSDVEARVETGVAGNIFTDPAQGIRFQLKAYNASSDPQALSGQLSVSDFSGHTVWEKKIDIKLPPQQAVAEPYAVLPGRQGFFRVNWKPDDGVAQSVRCAVIESYKEDDSLFGFNCAFSREYLLRLSHVAGMRWWRDWAAQWDVVQEKKNAPFDFHAPDLDVDYILGAGGRPLVLLPTPTAVWDADDTPERRRPTLTWWTETRGKSGKLNEYQLRRAMMSLKPKDVKDFADYVRATVKHYQGRVTDYEILNEAVCIRVYALPFSSGYKVSDYIDLLKPAYQAAKEADPNCRIVGGLDCNPTSKYEAQFVKEGGLQWCDIHDYHAYLSLERAEAVEPDYKAQWEQMKKLGQAKPIWVTEFGIYGEDDPTAVTSGMLANDPAMSRAVRPDELTASVDIVQYCTMMFANGVRKVFFQAGVNDAGLHGRSEGNIFFEYGGAPRKMYPAVAVLARLLGPDFEFARKWDKPEGVHAYEFRSHGRTVVILWTRKANAPKLEVPSGFQAFDLMGNPLDNGAVIPGEVPLYLVGRLSADQLRH